MKHMKINELAKLTGVTVRTLHYYDEIGLLEPSEVQDSGYRLYDESAVARMQQILFFRELEFPLNEIKEIMNSPKYDETKALEKHRDLLIEKRKRVDRLIILAEKALRGDNSMSFKEFDSSKIENIKKKYAEEVKRRWGNTAEYMESEEKTRGYNKEKWQSVNEQCEFIFKEFADNIDKSPDNPYVQKIVEKWQSFITENFYNCSKEILGCLGEMYSNDERFKNNINKYGEGVAEFMTKAIRVYCGL